MGIGPSLTAEEECNECRTPPITRILPKKYDPRSPSDAITRTPIEVVCTPKSNNLKPQLSLPVTCTTPKSSKSINVSNKSSSISTTAVSRINSSDCDEEVKTNNMLEASFIEECNTDTVCSFDLPDKDTSTQIASSQTSSNYQKIQPNETAENLNDCNVQVKEAYLETDIDAVEDSFNSNFTIEHPRVRQLRKCLEPVVTLSDESNNITAASNINDTVDTDTLSARIDSLSFTDFSFNDSSLLVSDNESKCFNDHDGPAKAINDWLITIEDDCHRLIPFHILKDDEGKVNNMQSQCLTPDRKIRSSKERTPLSCLVQNKVYEPIKENSSLQKKQWQSIQEERAKRGVSLADENTPPMPQASFYKVSSAPGKLMKIRRNIDWDQDNKTMLI